MSHKVKRRIQHTYTIEHEGHDYNVEFGPAEGADIEIRRLEDGRTVIGYLSQDGDPLNPRKEYDNFGTMICWHGRYDLGDEHHHKEVNDLWRELLGEDYERVDQETDAELNAWFEQNHQAGGGIDVYRPKQRKIAQKFKKQVEELLAARYIILPLFLFDHSGISLSTSSATFRACDSQGWDWGGVGYTYVSVADVLENWSVKSLDDPVHYEQDNTTKTARERAIDLLTGEVEEYDHYLTGECYGVCKEVFDKDGHKIEDDDHACWGFLGSEYAESSLTEEVDALVKYLTEKAKKEAGNAGNPPHR